MDNSSLEAIDGLIDFSSAKRPGCRPEPQRLSSSAFGKRERRLENLPAIQMILTVGRAGTAVFSQPQL